MKGKTPTFNAGSKLEHIMPAMKKGGTVKAKKKLKEAVRVEGKKAEKRLDKKSRGGKVEGRPKTDGMSAESPMSSASRSDKKDPVETGPVSEKED